MDITAIVLLVLITIGTAQVPISNWSISLSTLNHNGSNSSQLWQELVENGFESESGSADWYYSGRRLWLILYSDSNYQQALVVYMQFQKRLSMFRGSFETKSESIDLFYQHYYQLKLIDDFPDFSTMQQVHLRKRLITITHANIFLQAKLIDQTHSLYPHLFLLAIIILVKIAVATIKIHSQDQFQEEEDQTSEALKVPIYLFETYWFFFTASWVNFLPSTFETNCLSFILLTCTLCLMLHLIAAATSKNSFAKAAPLQKGLAVIFAIVYFIYVMKMAVAGVFRYIPSMITILYSLLLLTQVVHNCGTAAPEKVIGRPTFALYWCNVLLFIYITGWKACPLHHPQHPQLIPIILLIALLSTLLLFLPSITTALSKRKQLQEQKEVGSAKDMEHI